MTKKASQSSRKYKKVPLFDLEEVPETKKSIKIREAELRTSIDLSTYRSLQSNFPPITLPVRWEVLQAEANKKISLFDH